MFEKTVAYQHTGTSRYIRRTMNVKREGLETSGYVLSKKSKHGNEISIIYQINALNRKLRHYPVMMKLYGELRYCSVVLALHDER